MLDEKDLQAIAQLMGAKINDLEGHMTARMDKLDTRMDRMESRMDKLDTKVDDTESRILAYIEAAVLPKFEILAEGHQLLRETLAPKDRVEALEAEVSFMKQANKSMFRDIEALKKAQ